MADLLYWEGGEGYQDNVTLQNKITSLGGIAYGNNIASGTTVRPLALGTRSIQSSGSSGSGFWINLNQTTAYAEFWWSSGQSNLTDDIFAFQDSTGSNHFKVKAAQSGPNVQIQFFNANNVQVGSTYTVGLTFTWVHIAIKLIVGNTGTVIVRLDDNEVYNGSSDFQGTNGNIDRAFFQLSGNLNYFYFDDIVLQGSAGTFLGSGMNCIALRPTAAGDSTQWTPSAGSNWQNVDDTAPNGNTDYNSSSTPGQLDLFTTSDLPGGFSGNILGVDLWGVGRKDSGGTRQTKLAIKTNSGVYYGSNLTLTNSFSPYRKQFLVNPATGIAFTVSEINAMQIGAEVL